MTSINRSPASAAREQFALIVVGGGIYGASLALEASRRGLSTLLVERDDFGGATSFNSLRIVHGGLRYLQNGDLARYRRSVHEQAWWLTHFSDIVEPLACLMPLYNRGLKRMSTLKAALSINEMLASSVRRAGFGRDGRMLLPHSRMLTRRETANRFPLVDPIGLRGGALWFDARMRSPQRLLIEVLRWAAACGAKALNYMQCTRLIVDSNRAQGIEAVCQETGERFEFHGDHVVNCAGPWAPEMARLDPHQHVGTSGLGTQPLAIAFNVVLGRASLSEDAIALTPKRNGAPTYFVVPYQDQMMVGTIHLPDQPQLPSVDSEFVSELLTDLNQSISGLNVSVSDVTQVLAGRLPTDTHGNPTPSKTPRVTHHGQIGGVVGFTSLIGVKYTTARHVAQRVLEDIWKSRKEVLPPYGKQARPAATVRSELSELLRKGHASARELQTWISAESVVRPDDLFHRRCDSCRQLESSESYEFRLRLESYMSGYGQIDQGIPTLRDEN